MYMQSHTIHLSIAPGDYGALTGFSLSPFSNSVRQLYFNVPIVNDMIPEDDERFIANLTLLPADQARLHNRVTVQPDSQLSQSRMITVNTFMYFWLYSYCVLTSSCNILF